MSTIEIITTAQADELEARLDAGETLSHDELSDLSRYCIAAMQDGEAEDRAMEDRWED